MNMYCIVDRLRIDTHWVCVASSKAVGKQVVNMVRDLSYSVKNLMKSVHARNVSKPSSYSFGKPHA